MEECEFEEVPSGRPGDVVLRRTPRSRRRPRPVPTAPELFRVIRDILTTTPFLPMFLTLVALWLVFSAGIYALEHNADGAAMT